jgi:hypothetical protein
MRHETVTSAKAADIDWQGLGYVVSIAGVLLLAAVAWPGAADPDWHRPIVLAGVATSIIGMAFRYKAHLHQKREVARAKAEARSR